MSKSTSSEPINLPAARATDQSCGPINYALLALLDQWPVEDATDDPETIRLAYVELAEFKRAINENRVLTGEEPLFP